MTEFLIDVTETDCPICKRIVLVPRDAKAPYCFSCGRRVEPPDPDRHSNINANMQRLSSVIRDSGVFARSNTNTALARAMWEDLGKFLTDVLMLNEASIRYGYYGRPHEYDDKMLDRTRSFMEVLQKAIDGASQEVSLGRAADSRRP